MSSYNYTTTETEAEHAERTGAEETSEETRWCDTCQGWESTATACDLAAEAAKLAAEEAAAAGRVLVTPPAARVVRQKVICSCGYYTCAQIVRFGLIVPVFRAEIEPIPSQVTRDRRALQLRQEAAS